MLTTEELLARAAKPGEEAKKMHSFYRGKMQTMSRCSVRSLEDFSIWYTPGVAEPCKAIQRQPNLVYQYTNKWNSVAVVSDGSRVLGLGDIGPEAGLPVMEGKSLIFKYMGGVDAIPLCLATKDPEEIIRTVKILEPSFGGINLEDISHPKCFTILETLRREMDIPVWHDDQQGTATVILAGLINAFKVVGKKMNQVRIAQLGIGAAGTAVVRLLVKAGVPAENIRVLGRLNGEPRVLTRDLDLESLYPYRGEMLSATNGEGIRGGMAEAMAGADAAISLTSPGPGMILPEWVGKMAKDAVVFACANPIPEIWPWEAREAGARIVGTGRSDFPNQVNNSLGFPAIFRGALDVQASTITDEMCLAAAEALARYAENKGLLSDQYLIPTMDEWEAYPCEAAAVGAKAVEQGVAKVSRSPQELYDNAAHMILEARKMTELLMNSGHIAKAPI